MFQNDPPGIELYSDSMFFILVLHKNRVAYHVIENQENRKSCRWASMDLCHPAAMVFKHNRARTPSL